MSNARACSLMAGCIEKLAYSYEPRHMPELAHFCRGTCQSMLIDDMAHAGACSLLTRHMPVTMWPQDKALPLWSLLKEVFKHGRKEIPTLIFDCISGPPPYTVQQKSALQVDDISKERNRACRAGQHLRLAAKVSFKHSPASNEISTATSAEGALMKAITSGTASSML